MLDDHIAVYGDGAGLIGEVVPADEGVFVSPVSHPHYILGEGGLLAIELEDTAEGSDIEAILVDEHELETGEVAQVRERLQVVLGEVELDQIDAEAQRVDDQSVGRVQDQKLEAVVLRHQLLQRYHIFRIFRAHDVH